jgi:hypothetical protein
VPTCPLPRSISAIVPPAGLVAATSCPLALTVSRPAGAGRSTFRTLPEKTSTSDTDRDLPSLAMRVAALVLTATCRATHMREAGKPLPAELLAHTSPLTWEHIGFSGDFLWDRAAAIAGQRRALNLGREKAAA